ncbi:MAG TPA: hypothetical protein VK699_20975 [Terriglobales bacterium]|nr:hypothetical protein [Terriglobales bacterium]
MKKNRWLISGMIQLAALLIALLYTGSITAQPVMSHTPENGLVVSASSNDEQLAATRENLFNLLQMSPKFTGAVANDPSLLGDQEYVARSNPELAQFLQSHPEVARNPEFYLFGNFGGQGKSSKRLRLEHGQVSLDMNDPGREYTSRTINMLASLLVFVCFTGALLWLLRVLLENRRWSRLFKAQTDIYNKLLDRFSNNDELLAYVRDDAGKRFLESLSLPSSLWSFSRSPITRILAPLQLGVVLTLAGIGLIWVRGSVPDATTALTGALLIFGTLTLMLGIGLIISAGLSLILARHLGLISPAAAQGNASLETRERL